MRRALALALILLGFGGAIASHSIGMARAQGDHAAVIEIDGIIQPTSARFLARAIDTAGEQNAEVLIASARRTLHRASSSPYTRHSHRHAPATAVVIAASANRSPSC